MPRLETGFDVINYHNISLVGGPGVLKYGRGITESAATLNKLDSYEMNKTDLDDLKQQWRWDLATQLTGRFLIDRDGIVRWIDIECGRDGVAGIGKFSDEEGRPAAVRAL